MAEITQNVDSGMTPPTPEAIGMSVYVIDGRAYQDGFLMVPQYDPDTGDEIAPSRVGDTSNGLVSMPVADTYNENTFLNTMQAVQEMNDVIIKMPYGNQRGYPGQAILSDTTEMEFLTNPFNAATEVLDLKCLIVDNDSDNPCRVFIRPAPADATMYPFRCPSKETKMFVFSGVGPHGLPNGLSWTAQLESAPTGGNVTVSGFGIEINDPSLG